MKIELISLPVLSLLPLTGKYAIDTDAFEWQVGV